MDLTGRRPIPQQALLDDLEHRAAEGETRLRTLVAELSPAQLRWTPAPGAWGAGQVLEHLTVSARAYLPRLDALLADAPRRHGADATWRASFVGGFLLRALAPSSTRRVPAPRAWKVAAEPPADAATRYLATHAEVRALLRRAAETRADVTRARLASPVSPLLRMNVGDALATLVVHTERHLGQIERVRGTPGFPTA
jgi:uncharacterized damage-inducible protein DinB